MTGNLTNGVGEDVYIKMDFTIGQAIEDENALRREQASRRGTQPVLRSGMDGELRWP